MNLELHNFFYGTEDHYQHPGWYFDLIVDNNNDITETAGVSENDPTTTDFPENTKQVRPGRFILVKKYNAVFMRVGANESYYFVKPTYIDENNTKYYYKDIQNYSGKKYNPNNDEELQYVKDTYGKAITIIKGFRFVAYTNSMSQIVLGENLSIALPTSEDPNLYNVTSNLQYLASYYFDT